MSKLQEYKEGEQEQDDGEGNIKKINSKNSLQNKQPPSFNYKVEIIDEGL